MNWQFYYIGIFLAISILIIEIANAARSEETLRSPLQSYSGGWSTPSPSGWTEPVGPSSISIVGAAEVSGGAAASNTHSEVISVSAGWNPPRQGRRKMVQADPVARFYFDRDP